MLTVQSKTLQKGMYWFFIIFVGYLTAIITVNYQLFAVGFTVALVIGCFLINRFKIPFYLLLFIPFIYLEFAVWKMGGIGGRSYQFYLSVIIITLFTAEFLIKRLNFHIPVNDKINLFIFLFFFFNLLSMSFSINPDRSSRNITILLQIPFYFICAEIFYNKGKMLRYFAAAMTILGAVISCFVLLNYFAAAVILGHYGSLRGEFIQYSFLFHNANLMAYALLICLQFPLHKISTIKKSLLKNFYTFLLTIMSISILATYSRTGSALLVLSFLIFLSRYRIKKRSFIYISITLILFILSFNYFLKSSWYENYFQRFTKENTIGQFAKHRGATWKMALDEFADRPFLGVGQYVLIWELHDDLSLTHNTYVNILAERGLLTFIPYLLILICFFRLSRRLETESQLQHRHIFKSLTGVLVVHYLFSVTGDFPDSKFLWLIFSILTAEKIRTFQYRNSID